MTGPAWLVHTQLGNGRIVRHGDKKICIGAVQDDAL